jgi:hypothetical protein
MALRKKNVYFHIFLIIISSSCKQRMDSVNEQEAISIATDSLTQVIGTKSVEYYKPYHAKSLSDSVWLVSGTKPMNSYGGAPAVQIRKSDGKVLKVMIYK